MNRRVRKAVTSNALWLAVLVVVGLVAMPGSERTRWFLLWVPLAVLISVFMDYFVWNPEGSDQRGTQDLDNPTAQGRCLPRGRNHPS